MNRYPIYLIGCMAGMWLFSAGAGAEDMNDVEQLKQKVSEQDAVIQMLLQRIESLEAKIEDEPSAPQKDLGQGASSAGSKPVPTRVNLEEEDSVIPPAAAEGRFPILEWGGYIDVGYVDQQGEGAVASSSINVNSRGDNLATIGLDGDSSFLVNEVNIDLKAHVSEKADVNVSFDILPRDLGLTTNRGSASTDDVELDLAYLVYSPTFRPSPLTDALFGDLRLSLGKFESPMGYEYRINRSPDRVNISRSHLSLYTTGYPVGIRARANLFQDKLREYRNSILTYNLVVANSEPFMPRFGDGDVDDNSQKTVMGRFSYGLDVFQGFFELGTSVLHGGRIGQNDNHSDTDSLSVDTRFEKGPLTVRGEYSYGELDRSGTGSVVHFRAQAGEVFYEIKKPTWLSQNIPWVGLTPYYRYDTRLFTTQPLTGNGTVINVKRHTLALRYIPWSGNIIKAEYQFNMEESGPKVHDNLFLMSFIREF